MIRKISTNDLMRGMYVAELDRPWEEAPFEPPFDLQGFVIGNIEEIEKVQTLCRYVYIDPSLGLGSTKYLSEGYTDEDMAHMVEQITQHVSLNELYPELIPVEEEYERAQEILNDTHDVYHRVVKDLDAGRTVSGKSVEEVVGALVESVVRNPAAAAWLVQLKHRDESSYAQAISVCVLALSLGRFLGLPIKDMHYLGIAALLQDIGKIKVPIEILEKKELLTEEELERVRQHVDYSVFMLRSIEDINNEILEIVWSHHERFDGTGYPRRLSKSQINTLAFITGLADSYEAMMSQRPYRETKTSFEALMDLYGRRDQIFPSGLVEQFIQCVGIFPVGSFVKLNTNEVGIVVHRNRVQQLKPRVMVLIDRNGNKMSQPQTIDLAAQYLLPSKTPRAITNIADPQEYDLNPTEFFDLAS